MRAGKEEPRSQKWSEEAERVFYWSPAHHGCIHGLGIGREMEVTFDVTQERERKKAVNRR